MIVFNYPCPKKWRQIEMDVMQYYVKRCVALPGDTFCIVNGRYKVNGYAGDIGVRGCAGQVHDSDKGNRALQMMQLV